jgi:aminoglycoside phosphotransferase (APT) family kinase protein
MAAAAEHSFTPNMSWTTETTPVLDQHRFDAAALERFMLDNIDDFVAPLKVGQVRGGMSNPTFIMSGGSGQRYVLRKKPPGILLPSAHAVDREFRVISALWGTDVPVAKPYVLCQDPDVIGVDFYIMGFADGRVFRHLELPELAPLERRAIYQAMVDVMAKLHRVDFSAVGLEGYGRVGGYLRRQLRRWTQQYQAAQTETIEAMDNLMTWLPDQLPEDDETTIVHGDFRLENMIFHPTEPRVLAMVDWELSTLGSPLTDLAYNCLPYYFYDDQRGSLEHLDDASSGIPSEDEYIAWYCDKTGRDAIPHWPFYVVFPLWRLAAIVQGVYRRGLDGNASSPEAITRGEQVTQLAAAAWALVEQGKA